MLAQAVPFLPACFSLLSRPGCPACPCVWCRGGGGEVHWVRSVVISEARGEVPAAKGPVFVLRRGGVDLSKPGTVAGLDVAGEPFRVRPVLGAVTREGAIGRIREVRRQVLDVVAVLVCAREYPLSHSPFSFPPSFPVFSSLPPFCGFLRPASSSSMGGCPLSSSWGGSPG
jgi:hypothetical protein